MYIWIGCDISPRFTEFREKIIALSDELGLDKTVFNFPQHISLKIVFDTEEEIAKHCIKDIIELLKAEKPFTVKITDLERREGIIWLKTEQHERLKYLHEELDEIGKSYAVKPDKRDKEFIFHTTLAMDGDETKLDEAYEKLQGIPYPDEVKINTFLVAHSTDKVNFKVDRRIKVK